MARAPGNDVPVYFATPADLRAYLAKHHETRTEILVGFYKRDSGTPSITWPESVDEALCVGWIDGVRRRVDDERYTIRFTPRKPRSNWSAINIARVAELIAAGRMLPAGLAAFARREEARSAIYAYEQRSQAAFTPAQAKRFRADRKAWTYFQAQPPHYRQQTTYWVVSAKKDETRERRLEALIADSAAERWIGRLLAYRAEPPKKKTKRKPSLRR